MADLQVRPATAADAEAVARVHIDAWRAGYDGLMPADFLAALDWQDRAETWLERLTSPASDVGYLVATCGSVVGFCAFGAARDEDVRAGSCGEIYALNVQPSSWSTGAGSALLQASLEAMSAYDEVVLWVLAANGRARRFYERHGFVPDGKTKQTCVDGSSLDDLRYRRS